MIDIECLEFYLMFFLLIMDYVLKDWKKLLVRVKEMVKWKVLLMIRGEEDWYEIIFIICYVVNVGFLEIMLVEYIVFV